MQLNQWSRQQMVNLLPLVSLLFAHRPGTYNSVQPNRSSFPPLKVLQDFPDHGFVCSGKTLSLRVLLEEEQSLSVAELVFGDLVEACQILDDAA